MGEKKVEFEGRFFFKKACGENEMGNMHINICVCVR